MLVLVLVSTAVFTSFVRLLKFAVVDFARNVWLSMTTVLILTLTLVSVQVLIAVNVAGQIALEELESRVDLRVQFRPGVGEDVVDGIRVRLQALPEVTSVTHVATDEVLAAFQEAHVTNEEVLAALTELGENPFGPELRIRARSPEDFPAISALFDDPELAERIIETGAEDRIVLVGRLSDLTTRLRYAGVALSVLSMVVTLLILINAMRIITYVRRDEVGIMKLVGATNWFVRTPFLIMGVLAAALATILTQLLTVLGLRATEPTLRQFLGHRSVDIGAFFGHYRWEIVGAEFLGLALLTVIVSAVAIRRYLRV